MTIDSAPDDTPESGSTETGGETLSTLRPETGVTDVGGFARSIRPHSPLILETHRPPTAVLRSTARPIASITPPALTPNAAPVAPPAITRPAFAPAASMSPRFDPAPALAPHEPSLAAA